DRARGASAPGPRRPRTAPGARTRAPSPRCGGCARGGCGSAARRTVSPRAPALALPEREEVAMEAIVVGELGVERRREEVPLARRHDYAVGQRREGLDVASGARDLGRADEHRVIRRAFE